MNPDNWQRMHELRDSICSRTNKWDHVIYGEMLLGYKTWVSKPHRLPK